MESKNKKIKANQKKDTDVDTQTLKAQDSAVATVSAQSAQEDAAETTHEQETPTIVDAQPEHPTEDTPLETHETAPSDITRDEQLAEEIPSDITRDEQPAEEAPSDTIRDEQPIEEAPSNTVRDEQPAEADETPSDASPKSESQAIIVDADITPQEKITVPAAEKAATPKGPGAQIVRADSVQPEEVPTVPIDSLQALKALEPEVSVHSVASMRAISMPAPLVVQPAEYRRSLGERMSVWLDGMRFKYVPLSLLPALLGAALAWTQTITHNHLAGHLDIIHVVGFLLAVVILQVGANLINDYYDFQRGTDTSNPLGPGGLIQQGLIKPIRILITGLTFLVLGTIIGLISAIAGGAIACVIVLLLALAAYFFSASKFSLASLGLSELVGLFAFGPLPVIAAYLIQTHGGAYSNTALIYSLPLGFLGAAAIQINNLRDAEGDEHVGKRTLATLLGISLNRAIYTVLLLASYATIILVGVRHGAPHLILISLWTLPILVVAITGVLRSEISAGFHNVLKQTLKLQAYVAILLIIALVISALVATLAPLPHLLPF